MKISDDQSNDFSDYISDNNIESTDVYIHWHGSVSEYCVYIDGKWSGYVPDEYIFKSGFSNYKRWINAWEDSHANEIYFSLIDKYVRTCVQYCENSTPDDYMIGVKFFVDIVQHRRVLPNDIQKMALTRMNSWLLKYEYSTGSEYITTVLEKY